MTRGNSAIQRAIIDYVGDTGLVFTNPETKLLLEGGIEKTDTEATLSGSVANDGIFIQDIAQSHHFTVWIDGFSMSKFRTPEGTFSEFLPVKTMNLNYTSYENMTIPLSIFGDFPVLNKKRVSTIQLTCYDLDNNKLEYELRKWEDSCFPKGRYVAYMEDIARKFIYRGYNVKGRQTLMKTMYVIPSGSVSVSRDYSANDAKMLSFSLVCVGDGSTCATGNGAGIGDIPVIDHGGGGTGEGLRHFATPYATGWGQYDASTDSFKL